MLDDTPERVSMGGNQNLLSLFQLWNDDVVPVWKGALDRQLQRLVHGEFLLAGFVGVTRVLCDDFVKLVRFFQRRWWNIETTPPNKYLPPTIFQISSNLTEQITISYLGNILSLDHLMIMFIIVLLTT